MYKRRLNILELLEKKSFFLFGPRGTGKSFWIRESVPDLPRIDLLDTSILIKLSTNPNHLQSMVPKGCKQVAIDEFQKLPELLNEVHRLIENEGIHFLLTGSSTRRLKKPGVNLLGGRARTQHFYPLTSQELASDFDLKKFLTYGGLPAIYKSTEPHEDLHAYIDGFLKEEVLNEARLRNLPQFSKFLKTAALTNGELLNFSKVGSDAEIAPATVREYFYLLQDTLMGFLLEPWQGGKKRKAVQTAKFYFFDPGIPRTILNDFQLSEHSDQFGKAFEHFIGLELRAYLGYSRKHYPLYFWRTTTQDEVDFVVEDHLAIEVKATEKVTLPKAAQGLLKLKEENRFKKLILVSRDPEERTIDGIECLHWKTFLTALWDGEIF